MTCVNAGRHQGVHARRISFINALRSLRQVLLLRCAGEPPPRLLVNPHRPARIEPRRVKRRPPQRRYLTTPPAPQRANTCNNNHLPLSYTAFVTVPNFLGVYVSVVPAQRASMKSL
jgi:hypothetical protein